MYSIDDVITCIKDTNVIELAETHDAVARFGVHPSMFPRVPAYLRSDGPACAFDSPLQLAAAMRWVAKACDGDEATLLYLGACRPAFMWYIETLCKSNKNVTAHLVTASALPLWSVAYSTHRFFRHISTNPTPALVAEYVARLPMHKHRVAVISTDAMQTLDNLHSVVSLLVSNGFRVLLHDMQDPMHPVVAKIWQLCRADNALECVSFTDTYSPFDVHVKGGGIGVVSAAPCG